MSQDSSQPIQLSVHERSDPNAISRTPDAEMDAAQEDLNGAVPDQDNMDVPTPGPSDAVAEDTIADDQTMSVNRHAG